MGEGKAEARRGGSKARGPTEFPAGGALVKKGFRIPAGPPAGKGRFTGKSSSNHHRDFYYF